MSKIDLVKQGQAAWAAGDVTTLANLLADDFTFSGAAPQSLDKTAFLGLCQASYTAAKDFNFNASDWREEGDKVTCTARISSTHTGVLAMIPGVPPVPPTGKFVQQPEEHQVYTFRGDKLVNITTDSMQTGGGIPFLYAAVGSPLPPIG